MAESLPFERRQWVSRALRLEGATIAWMAVEASVAIAAGLAAGSLSLIAFGADSAIELASAGVLLWRLTLELARGAAFPEAVERRAAHAGALLLGALSLYILASAAVGLWTGRGQQFSPLGLAVTAAAIPVMLWLAREKRRLAARIDSPALRADAAESTACAALSAILVLGLAAQLVVGAWWIDAVTALALVPFLVREGLEAWQAEAD
jgi:divalent metal cation (Fe/Co/Zn/Cd) transporter